MMLTQMSRWCSDRRAAAVRSTGHLWKDTSEVACHRSLCRCILRMALSLEDLQREKVKAERSVREQ